MLRKKRLTKPKTILSVQNSVHCKNFINFNKFNKMVALMCNRLYVSEESSEAESQPPAETQNTEVQPFEFKVPTVPKKKTVKQPHLKIDELETVMPQIESKKCEFKVPLPPGKRTPHNFSARSSSTDHLLPVYRHYHNMNVYKYKLRTVKLRLPITSDLLADDLKRKLKLATKMFCDCLRNYAKASDYAGVHVSAKFLPYGRVWMPFRSMKTMKMIHISSTLKNVLKSYPGPENTDGIIAFKLYVGFAMRQIRQPNGTFIMHDRRQEVVNSIKITEDNLHIPKCLIDAFRFVSK